MSKYTETIMTDLGNPEKLFHINFCKKKKIDLEELDDLDDLDEIQDIDIEEFNKKTINNPEINIEIINQNNEKSVKININLQLEKNKENKYITIDFIINKDTFLKIAKELKKK
jgi:hypothetical protein